MMKRFLILKAFAVAQITAFAPIGGHVVSRVTVFVHPGGGHPGGGVATAEAEATGFIDTELRGAAMRLHTRSQAPKEGQAQEAERKPYTPTHIDYLRFLIDSQAVYQAFEGIINDFEELKAFQNTGLERSEALETDINFMVKEYDLARPEVGSFGKQYADQILALAAEKKVPELICHYYNHYFAHTAGGRMIGKQMSALLLNKKTLEFYKWDGDLNEIKNTVKQSIETMASSWTEEERRRCVDETASAFQGGGGINAYLSGAESGH